jgi:hypothetical protein
MIPEIIISILDVLNLILLFIGVYAALRATKDIVDFGHPHHETNVIKKKIFPLLCWGMIFLLGGNLAQSGTQFLENNLLLILGTILIWLSYVLFIIGLGYFWYATKEIHHISTKERWFFAGVVGLVVIWNSYLFVKIIFPVLSMITTMGKIILIINPILITMMFILTFAVHPRIKAGVVDSSLGYISGGVFVYFLGFMLIQYTLITENIIIVMISGILIIISSAYYWLGFVVARKKVLCMQETLLKVPTIKQEIGKISTDINKLNEGSIFGKQPSKNIGSNKPIKKAQSVL